MAPGTSRSNDCRRARASRRADPEGTRGKLICAALALVGERGIEGTSMADIAQRAGVCMATLGRHFPNERALVLHLIDEWGARIEAQRDPDGPMKARLSQDPGAALAHLLRGYYERLNGDDYLYAELALLTYCDPELREHSERLRRAGSERLAAIVEFGQAQGLFRMEPTPEAAASLMISALELLTLHVLKLQRPAQDTERMLEELTDMIRRYLIEQV